MFKSKSKFLTHLLSFQLKKITKLILLLILLNIRKNSFFKYINQYI
jgi:hypothetical protein